MSLSPVIDLTGKVALVTGAGSGIGRASALRYAQAGASVMCADIDADGAKVTAESIRGDGGEDASLQLDVTDETAVEKSLQQTIDALGGFDILFNNAGGPSNVPGQPHAFNIEDVSEESFKYSQWYLLGSCMVATKHASPIMRKQGSGSIIMNSSKGAHQAEVAADPLYSAAKAGLSNYTKAAAMQLGPMGVRVNAVSPGAIATPIFWGGHTHGQQITAEHKEKRLSKFVNAVSGGLMPLKGPGGEAWDIAQACVYLGSDDARWVTGIDLVVDGGMLAVKGDHVGTTKRMIDMWQKHDEALGRT